MRIEKIKSSNALRRGQLLAIAKPWKCFGSVPELGPAAIYRHRQGPVSGIHRRKHGRWLRHRRTTNERRANSETPEKDGVVSRVRGKRKSDRLPSTFDDLCLCYQRSWEKYRRIQRKDTADIDRRVHGAPYWDSFNVS